MGELLRSQPMQLVQLFVQFEAAHDTVDELGKLGLIEFRDLNPEVNAFQRNFVGDVAKYDEMERKLRFFSDEVEKEKKDLQRERKVNEPLQFVKVDQGRSDGPFLPMEELKAKLEDSEKEIIQMNQNQEMLMRNYNELIELKFVLTKDAHFFQEEGGVAGEEAAKAPIPMESGKMAKLGFVSGVILREKFIGFEKVLWRATRGNLFMKHAEIEEKIKDPHTNEMVEKNVFIIFFQGQRAQGKIKKICESFGANIHQVPEGSGERKDLLNQVEGRISDLDVVLQRTKKHRRSVLWDIGRQMEQWKERVLKEKSIYHTMNLFNYDMGRKCLIAEGWCPQTATDQIIAAMRKATESSGALVPSILSVIPTQEEPPTYFKTNKFTSIFQGMIEAYGVPHYGEINPTPFTIITFPFLFGMMFGDLGHGTFLTAFALYLIINEKKLATVKNEMLSMVFAGRYILILMGIFATYVGLIYNECFSVALNFGTGWKYFDNENGTYYEPIEGYTYPVGVDPAWNGAANTLTYYNSLKMKLSVILGVFQMTMGIVVSAMNGIHHRSPLHIFGEVIPQFLFLNTIFGYLVFLIFFKWLNSWNPNTAPFLLTTLVNMFLSPGNIDGVEMYSGQGTVQVILVLIALVCVPWMFLAKPLVLRYQHNTKKEKYLFVAPQNPENGEHANHPQPDSHDGHDDGKHGGGHGGHGGHDEPFDFTNLMIKQMIHTIEFVLGAISNTASYLRLWALSLAHSELSKVFYDTILVQSFEMGPSYLRPIVVFIGFAGWAGATFGVLLIMESLSAFLHALRLHWVEFQNKFYHGDGRKFVPFSYRRVLGHED